MVTPIKSHDCKSGEDLISKEESKPVVMVVDDEESVLLTTEGIYSKKRDITLKHIQPERRQSIK